jgi:YHS domain-containing protein
MSRLILALILLGILYWVVRRALFSLRGQKGRPEEGGEEMVQDPVCRCYVPKKQAYSVSYKGKQVFFCSEECFKKYMASNALPKD